MTKTLIVVSSLTGNTAKVAKAVHEGVPDSLLVRASEFTEEMLADCPNVILAFWCDKGAATEEIVSVAGRISEKRMGFVATMGGDASGERAKAWMQKTCAALAGQTNEVAGTFLCRGRISKEVFDRMTAMLGGVVTEQRRASFESSQAHPDAGDCEAAVAAMRAAFA